MTLQELRAFVATVETGSLSGAADALKSSRATVRRHLDSLEQTLGAKLLVRDREGARATGEGEALLTRARTLLGEARALVTSVRERMTSPEGRLRVALHVGYPAPVLASLQSMVHRRLPGASVEFFISENPGELLPDKVDIAFSPGRPRGPADFAAVPVMMFQQLLLASDTWIEKNGLPRDVTEAMDSLVAGWRGPDESGRELHLRDGTSRPIEPRVVTSDDNYLHLVAAEGRGLVYAPLPPVPLQSGATKLVPVLADQVGRPLTAWMISPRALTHTPRAIAMREIWRKMFDAAI